MFILASPWFWGIAASATSAALGWAGGFFGSDSIKNLTWVALILAALLAFYFVSKVVS